MVVILILNKNKTTTTMGKKFYLKTFFKTLLYENVKAVDNVKVYSLRISCYCLKLVDTINEYRELSPVFIDTIILCQMLDKSREKINTVDLYLSTSRLYLT